MFKLSWSKYWFHSSSNSCSSTLSSALHNNFSIIRRNVGIIVSYFLKTNISINFTFEIESVIVSFFRHVIFNHVQGNGISWSEERNFDSIRCVFFFLWKAIQCYYKVILSWCCLSETYNGRKVTMLQIP